MSRIERSSHVYTGRDFYRNRPIASQAPILGRDAVEAHEYQAEVLASAGEHNLTVLPCEPIIPIIGTSVLRTTVYGGMDTKAIRRDPDMQDFLAKANAIDGGSSEVSIKEPVTPIRRTSAAGQHRGSIGLRVYDMPIPENPTKYILELQRAVLREELELASEPEVHGHGIQSFPTYVAPIVKLPHNFLQQDGAMDWIKETVPQIETPEVVTLNEVWVYEKEVTA